MMAIATSRKKKELPYLCFTANTDNSSVRLDKVGTPPNISLKFSYDGNNWEDYTWSGDTDVQGDPISLVNIGDKVYFRAASTNGAFAYDAYNYHHFVISGKIAASGNIQSLVDSDMQIMSLFQFHFVKLFMGCSSLSSIPNLTATELSEYSYYTMFKDCYGLESVELNAEISLQGKRRALRYMFQNCTNLSEVKVKFTSWDSTQGNNNATDTWLDNVAANGTFICPAELPTERSTNRIPQNWTVKKEGYYYNGNFYDDAEHTTASTLIAGEYYIDIPTKDEYYYNGNSLVPWGGTTS